MYCDSYNLTHGENALTVEYKIDKSAPGYIYKVKGAEQNNGYWTNNDTVDYTGYHSMYCGKDENKGDYWWWLASPSAGGSNRVCFVGGRRADLGNDCNDGYGVCPLVSLKSTNQITLSAN